MSVRLLCGDCRTILPTLPAESVHCVVTSPPYWGLRDYGTATWDGGDMACDHRGPPQQSAASTLAGNGHGNGKPLSPSLQAQAVPYRDICGKCGARRLDQQLGLEPTPEAYIATMVAVFREVRRVLRADGTLWLNMGDSYASGEIGRHDNGSPACDEWDRQKDFGHRQQRRLDTGLKAKDLVGMPWRLAFALQADGWFLRADIIWAKPNPMPESVTDRPTKAHEYIFLLTKSARYFYDADAVREPSAPGTVERFGNGHAQRTSGKAYDPGRHERLSAELLAGRNLRSVWSIPSAAFPLAHFATFPPALASRCIQAGSSGRGCCRACGAPWARQVETPPEPPGFRTAKGDGPKIGYQPGMANHLGAGQRLQEWRNAHPPQTLGWVPTCPCPPSPPVPCTILDPFAGSGTVGEVAEQLGRHSVLIELSPAYARMADERTAQYGLFTQEEPRP
jgi:DNA modification methylase